MAARISGLKARRYTNIWRGAAIVVGVSAAALWAVQTPLASPDVDLPTASSPAPGPEGERPETAQLAPVDSGMVADSAERLNAVLGRVAKAQEVDPQPAETAPVGITGWRYLGSIVETRRKVAIVSVDGKQAVLAEGREFNGVRVVEVKPGALVVDDGSGLKEMQKEVKSGPSVAWVAQSGGGSGVGAMNPGMNPGMTTGSAMTTPAGVTTFSGTNGGATQTGMPGGYTPEQMAQLRERGIDPAQAQRMRDRLQQQRQRGRMTPEGDAVSEDGAGSVKMPPRNGGNQKDADGNDGAGPDAPTTE